MAKKLPELKLSNNSFEELFSTQEQRDADKQERIVEIKCNEIDPFPNHPFKVIDNAEMLELANSIKENGIMLPLLVRPTANGRYEMISGHRRRHAALIANMETVPAIVRNLTDDEATTIMVDSNLKSREVILPSEKAFAYKMRLEAMNRQGQRTDLTLTPVVSKSRTNEQLGAEVGESREQIRRYIRLTNLIPELLEMVDNSVIKPDDKEAFQMALRPAVELSYLSEQAQKYVMEFIESNCSTPSHAQAIQLKNMAQQGVLTPGEIFKILSVEKPNQKQIEKLSTSKFIRFFPPNTSAKEMEKTIETALEFYQKAKERQVKQTHNTKTI